ncbi:hypothetical protein QWJ34_04775 [Saccharibacillus sp. CPCC 101409]|uniref:hypothetical protein n=1 Tax=Saccharibacillus sp. CPCC 101409 TaxID=3058041 RepID=UPI00267199F1|nr:hypothetical protein [Saccharibacillus sp. CPCC 101409]MDO3409068.1 hypothetical protein [Saccharibacillus sp. CPCC 101409]
MGDLSLKIQTAFELFDAGRPREVEALYRLCLDEPGGREGRAYRSILHGLGYIKCEQGRYGEARSLYEELAALARSDADPLEEAIALAGR